MLNVIFVALFSEQETSDLQSSPFTFSIYKILDTSKGAFPMMCPIFIWFAKVFFWLPFLFQKKSNLLASFLNCYSYGYSHTNHGVVTCADETHHFYVSGNRGRACELSVAVHSSESICHTVGSGACCHVIGMECTSCTAARSNREVLNTVFSTPLLVCTCNGMLESCGVGGLSQAC